MPSPTADRDERLAALLDDLSRQRRAGATPDLDPITRQHPDLADELRQLWAAAQMADALARPAPPTLPAAPTPADPEPPRTFGDFELVRELGRGGMGVVYEARQRSLNRTVALKMVLRGDLASAADQARFRAEAEAAARLVHPNIVQVYEVGDVAGQPYFAMQYVPGPTLARRLADGPLPPREAASLVAAVARAVDHAHQNGVLHRDLKPANILLAQKSQAPNPKSQPGDSSGWDLGFGAWDSSPKVSDFGLAKLIDAAGSLTQTGAIVGTPSYMSPEQARAEKHLTPAADVYALGAILYECLTGRPPFQAATPYAAIQLVLEQDAVPPRLLNPGVPRDLETVCLKCLEKTPGRRYATAAGLAADLEAFVSGEPVAARPSGLVSFIDRLFQETPHAAVLENWGVLWMWHSLVLLLLCTATQVLAWTGYGSHTAYLLLWSIGLITWGTIFWQLRRRGGPVRFVERQIGHAWAAGVCASIGMFVLEVLMGYPPLTFSPLLAVAAGMVFLFKAGVLAGLFYFAALAMFATAVLMAVFPQVGVLLFGIVTAACFFFPGLKYYRQRLRRIGE
ncbi:MAG TPA: serine/threonine-protein kinase [Gemmataceae bacterium]|jgi:serine/threonine-protein kinase